jgi:archaemetzincin
MLLLSCTSNNKVIVIQPLGDFPQKDAEIVLKEILKLNPNTVLRKNIPFPSSAYYKPRNRYRADVTIKHLKEHIGQDSVIVGLSNKDISTTNGKIKDWGVMGLGYQPGKSCIVSNYRLSQTNKREQFHKVVLHELGHTQGLPHCPNKTCLMRDAEGKNVLDQETGFCKPCKKHLISKNWKIK